MTPCSLIREIKINWIKEPDYENMQDVCKIIAKDIVDGGKNMKTMAISKFKTHALKIVDQIAKSQERVIITKRGKPLADTWIWWNMCPQNLSQRVKTLISDSSKYDELLCHEESQQIQGSPPDQRVA
jgi:hypothetical protein